MIIVAKDVIVRATPLRRLKSSRPSVSIGWSAILFIIKVVGRAVLVDTKELPLELVRIAFMHRVTILRFTHLVTRFIIQITTSPLVFRLRK